MNRIMLSATLIASSLFTQANPFENDSINQAVLNFEVLSQRWQAVSDKLETYRGLSVYCMSGSFRKEVIDVLDRIYEFDHLLYDRLVEMKTIGHAKHKIKTTLHQIEKLEIKYDIQGFKKHLEQECEERGNLQADASVDNREIWERENIRHVEALETLTYKYIHHVARLVSHIRQNVHHLSIERKL
ncbi:MAG: hypothetical protein KI790_03690 [Cyclobacteriaceae bacterium]|nr:hypothetical protein [Cyclobacteriaceae bacterium HetDA_MAG_MS6]